MSHPKLINLLDDFALGGVSRGLGIFDSAPIRAVVEPAVVAIDPKALIAPRLDADVIVTHFPPNWRRLIFLASLRARNRQAKIIHVEHSYTRSWEAANVPNKGRFRAMLRHATGLVDQIVCVSTAQADWLAEATGMARSAIEVIYPYAANPGLDQLALPDFAAGLPLRIGAYGRFHEANGFDGLIEAFKAGALPGTELVFGGFGPDEQKLHALAEGVDGIRFVGKVTDVAAFLETCDVVAIPSRWEAFGQVATEAREAGRPIFVAPIDGLVEQVGWAGKIVDFTSDAAIEAVFSSTSREDLTLMARDARRSTRCAQASRLQDWANLLTSIAAPEKKTAEIRSRVASAA